jgi:hypothetical protein
MFSNVKLKFHLFFITNYNVYKIRTLFDFLKQNYHTFLLIIVQIHVLISSEEFELL